MSDDVSHPEETREPQMIHGEALEFSNESGQAAFFVMNKECSTESHRKPVLSSSSKKTTPLSKDDLETKLQATEVRRQKQIQLRAQRCAEHNEALEKLSNENKQTAFFVVDEKSAIKAPRKPVLSSSRKKNTPLSKDDLEKKLQAAEVRRQKQIQLKAQRCAESRENMLEFASKMEKLSALREKTLKGQKFGNYEQNDKKMYVQLCKEISGQFEMLSYNYKRDLRMAGLLQECFSQDSSESSNASTATEEAKQGDSWSTKGTIFCNCEQDSGKRFPGKKPTLSSSSKENNPPLTREDIDRKLQLAEERRQKQLKDRSNGSAKAKR